MKRGGAWLIESQRALAGGSAPEWRPRAKIVSRKNVESDASTLGLALTHRAPTRARQRALRNARVDHTIWRETTSAFGGSAPRATRGTVPTTPAQHHGGVARRACVDDRDPEIEWLGGGEALDVRWRGTCRSASPRAGARATTEHDGSASRASDGAASARANVASKGGLPGGSLLHAARVITNSMKTPDRQLAPDPARHVRQPSHRHLRQGSVSRRVAPGDIGNALPALADSRTTR
jgi:hypothetical protein